MPRRNNYTHDGIYSRLSRNKCAIRAPSLLVLLSGAKTACRIDAPGAARTRTTSGRTVAELISRAWPPSLTLARPCPGPRPVSLAGLAEAREVINHRAINNRYFSSNVYRVRFKRLVKTNLRPRALFAPLGPPHPDTRWWTRATGIYHG